MSSQPSLPFPTLTAATATQQQQPSHAASTWAAAPFPAMIPASLAAAGPAGLSSTNHPNAHATSHAHAQGPQMAPHPQFQGPFQPQPLQTHTAPQPQAPPRLAAHVAVPAALLREDDDMPPLESAVHAPSSAGHSHDGQACNHSHGPVSPARTASPKSHSSSAAHGHSHGDGAACSGDHGHSASASSSSARKFIPPSAYDDGPSISSFRPVTGSLPVRAMAWASMAWRGGGDPRAVLLYVSLKLSMMALQFLWGIWSGNLGIVSSSFHTGFDVLALCCSLIAMLLAKYPASHPFSYGLDRTEVTAAFTNTIFLFFVATFQIIETFHTGYAPPEVGQDDIGLASAGLIIDVVGLVLFGRYTSLKPGGAAEEALAAHAAAGAANGASTSVWSTGSGALAPLPSSGSLLLGANSARGHFENMHGVSLHVVADLIGHTSLLAAVWIFARYPGFPFVFALSFLFSAVVIIRLVLPLFQSTAAILLMTTPPHLQQSLDRGVREISFYDGVLELRSAHWWMQSPGAIVGSMHLRIRSDANEQVVLTYVQGVLGKFCQRLTVQVEKDAVIANSWIQQQISP